MPELPKIKYSGKIREISIGKSGCEVTLGGETAYSFYSFEGNLPHVPKLALQVQDIEPEDWAPEALEPFKDVVRDPVAWARKCADVYRADAVCLLLAGTDPNGRNLSARHAADVSKAVAEAINVPLIVWGVSSDEKNAETLKAVAEACSGLNLVIGPVTENNYKQIGAAAIAYKHVVVASSPIDINLAKQLNILLENLGIPKDKIIIDPTTGGVGYGLEYSYSIMERIRQAALTQNDDKLQYPILNVVGEEVWKVKEAKLPTEEDPSLGEVSARAINLEAITAVSVLQAGSDLLVLRHPKTLEYIRRYLTDLIVRTDLASMGLDLSLPGPAVPAAAAKVTSAPAVEQPSAPEIPVERPEAEIQQQAVQALLPEQTPEPPVEPEPFSAPAAPQERELTSQLTTEEIQGLKEMVGVFRAIKHLIAGSGTVTLGPAATTPVPAPLAAQEGLSVVVAQPEKGETTPVEAARNFALMIAAGAAAQSDRGRHVAETFLSAAKGDLPDCQIKDTSKLLAAAGDFGVETAGREIKDIAVEVAEKAQSQFGRQDGELCYIKRAPEKRQQIWRDRGVVPPGIDRPVVEAFHMTYTAASGDMDHIERLATKCALADGWGGSMIAADLSDILQGTPVPVLGKVNTEQQDMIEGFSYESIGYMLGGTFRASYRPLNDNIINGRIRGLAAIVGCDDVEVQHDDLHVNLAKVLIKNDILVLTTGGPAIALGKAGLLLPEAAGSFAGDGLAEVCEMAGIPPCLHVGNSTDNSRILMVAAGAVREGGFGDDISDLPAVCIAPEWTSEKAVSIGQCFVSSGFCMLFGRGFPTVGEGDCRHYPFRDIERIYGGKWDFVDNDPYEMARRCIAHIDAKRKALGIDRARERVLMDMAMRREIA